MSDLRLSRALLLAACGLAPAVLRYQLPGEWLFGFVPLAAIFYLVWIAGTVLTTLRVFSRDKPTRIRASAWLAILTPAGAMAFILQYYNVMRTLDWEFNYGHRIAAVAYAKEKGWQDGNYVLDPRLAGAADQSRILVRHRDNVLYVAFPILHWGIDNWEAFVFSSDGSEPPPRLFPDHLSSAENVKGNWFFVIFT